MSKKNKGKKKGASRKQVATRVEKMVERMDAHRLKHGEKKYPFPKPKRKRVA